MNSLNFHSGRWCEADFRLPAHYIAALCGTSPPKSLCKFLFSNINYSEPDYVFLEFKMKTKPSAMEFKISHFPLGHVDVAWHNLVPHLDLEYTSLDGVLQVIRDAPLLEISVLCDIFPSDDDAFPTAKTIIRNPQVRTLEASWTESEVSTDLMNYHLWSRGS